MQGLFANIYKNKRVLVTGHTGFKGSWLVLWLEKLGAVVGGYSLKAEDPSHFNLLSLSVQSQIADIRNKKELEDFFLDFKPEIIFHLAAQPLVRDSYRDPHFTYETNVMGTLNVLEASRKCASVKAIVNITTDKVYENNGSGKPYTEADALGGHDMYSSSKACSELLSSSFRYSFLNNSPLLLATVRAGNVIGGGDWGKERLIPDLIKSAANGKTTEIRSPQSIRPWEHVLEPLSGYLLLGQKLLEGNAKYAVSWNFGPSNEQNHTVLEMVEKMKFNWDKIHFEINVEAAGQFREAAILKLDCSKALKELKWQSVWNIDKTIAYTVEWYKNYFDKNHINSENDIYTYINDARNLSLSWTQ